MRQESGNKVCLAASNRFIGALWTAALEVEWSHLFLVWEVAVHAKSEQESSQLLFREPNCKMKRVLLAKFLVVFIFLWVCCLFLRNVGLVFFEVFSSAFLLKLFQDFISLLDFLFLCCSLDLHICVLRFFHLQEFLLLFVEIPIFLQFLNRRFGVCSLRDQHG